MTVTSHDIRRERIKRFVEAGGLVVAVDVTVIYAPEQPDEPLLEAQTLRFLDEVTRRAEAGDIPWLECIGRVYVPRTA